MKTDFEPVKSYLTALSGFKNTLLEGEYSVKVIRSEKNLIKLVESQWNVFNQFNEVPLEAVALLTSVLDKSMALLKDSSNQPFRMDYLKLANEVGDKKWANSKKIKTGLLCLGIVVLSGVLIGTTFITCGGTMMGLCFTATMLSKIGLAGKITTSVVSGVFPFSSFFGAYCYHKRTVTNQMQVVSRHTERGLLVQP